MGGNYAEGVILDLQKMWDESDIRTPLICFLSMGSDPTNSIDALAKRLNTECRAISMGQGQEVHARRLLQQSMAAVSSRYFVFDLWILPVCREGGCCYRIATWD
jgi:dynein heavy chain